VTRSLLFLVEDYQRLWAVTGFAERFAAQLAWPGVTGEPLGDPYRAVLGEHHRRLVTMLQAGDLAGGRGPDELAKPGRETNPRRHSSQKRPPGDQVVDRSARV